MAEGWAVKARSPQRSGRMAREVGEPEHRRIERIEGIVERALEAGEVGKLGSCGIRCARGEKLRQSWATQRALGVREGCTAI